MVSRIKRVVKFMSIVAIMLILQLPFTLAQAPGDANGDGNINILDVTVILNEILEIAPDPGNGDCNNDGAVNILDVTCVLNIILEITPTPTVTPTPTPPTPTPTPVVVEFVYEAATEVDPGVAQQFPQCVQGVGQTHIHPSWRNFVRIDMTADNADRWSITFTDVAVDSEQRIRISDPNACASDPNGASTENVFANGTQLLRVVDTPGNGIEPGLAFIVSPSGEVFP